MSESRNTRTARNVRSIPAVQIFGISNPKTHRNGWDGMELDQQTEYYLCTERPPYNKGKLSIFAVLQKKQYLCKRKQCLHNTKLLQLLQKQEQDERK